MRRWGECGHEFAGDFGSKQQRSARSAVSLWADDESIDPDDIMQGRLGDCYFLAACADLAATEAVPAEDGDEGVSDPLVRDLIIEEGLDVGVLGVKFYVMGRWVSLLIDDLFPTTVQGGVVTLCGCQLSSQGEMWPAVLEKAFAKLHGSFEALDGGHSDDALNYLCGGHCKKFDLTVADSEHGGADAVWEQLVEEAPLAHPERASFLSCSVKPGVSAEEAKARGLFAQHAYSLLGVLETSSGLRLLKLRNPHGGTEWNGAFSDGAPEWTAALKAEVPTFNTSLCRATHRTVVRKRGLFAGAGRGTVPSRAAL